MNDFKPLLEPILDYKMDPMEAKAYKIGLLWLYLVKKAFPKESTPGYPKKGDPRKSLLFKYCYKLLRETQGLIEEGEYKLYLKAQIDLLKSIDMGGYHPQIVPQCIAGDKAWIRWKIWKKKFDNVSKVSTKKDVGLDAKSLELIIKELKQTKDFLAGRFGAQPTEEQIMMAARDMERWIALDKVSPYYAILSPWFNKHCKNVTIDLSLWKSSVDDEITSNFKKIFDYEYIT